MEKELQEYTLKDAAQKLEVSSVTLRRWCQLLENAGYRFSKPDGTKRRLTEADWLILEKFKRWSSVMTQEEAADLLVLQLNRDNTVASVVNDELRIQTVEQPADAPQERVIATQLTTAADQFEACFGELEQKVYWNGGQAAAALSYLTERWQAFKTAAGLMQQEGNSGGMEYEKTDLEQEDLT